MKKYHLLAVFPFLAVSLLCASNAKQEESKIEKSTSYVPARNELPTEDVEDTIVLRIMNMEEYIYEQSEEDEPIDLVDQFVEWCAEETPFKNVEVVYDTTDTNETLLTQLQLGSAYYDLICPSEYMIQKMIREDLIQPLNRPDRDELLADYDTYASAYVRGRLDNIEVKNGQGETVHVGDYAVGYMWGTLGLLFNPEYNDMYIENSIADMDSWSVLYNQNYNGTISIKDSMRDTYAAILMSVYAEELQGYREQYLASEITAEQYNAHIQEVFNRIDDETLGDVKSSLDELKSNIFGLEVDSGKQDIVQGKIGINLAWSGDAVYAIELGEEEEVPLNYAIPLEGSNIWFDAWVMPKLSSKERSEYQEQVAYLFLNFISMPENATQNMDSTGYTSFIGGEDILNLVREWYDDRYNEELEDIDTSIDTEDMQLVDLNYFFNPEFGTPSYQPNPDYYFYSEEYYIENNEGELSESVGGMFFTQYPDEETITRCAVMKDFGERNDAVLKMWEAFKSNSLPLWAIILLVVEVTIIATLVIYFVAAKSLKKKLRIRRNNQIRA